MSSDFLKLKNNYEFNASSVCPKRMIHWTLAHDAFGVNASCNL
ncbi:hypothetical protein HMPREF9446_01288 [Bacteroides fluxus YIT 12057]|uniref:Uncharacterized protein n=1 Tax=Bacteroides fluxus YIT 12057 TaxID=763034 RepID=F3PRD8_9BACE|nr:hypothetical protein HMPREF9446_01288 [Bacteroides fluxus YIT 12057]